MSERKKVFLSLDGASSYKSISVKVLSRCDVHGYMEEPSPGAEIDNSDCEYPSIEICAHCLVELIKACAEI